MDSWTESLDMLAQNTNKKCAAFASDEPDGRGWYLAFSPGSIGEGLGTCTVLKMSLALSLWRQPTFQP